MLSGESVTLNLILRKLSWGPFTVIVSWSAEWLACAGDLALGGGVEQVGEASGVLVALQQPVVHERERDDAQLQNVGVRTEAESIGVRRHGQPVLLPHAIGRERREMFERGAEDVFDDEHASDGAEDDALRSERTVSHIRPAGLQRADDGRDLPKEEQHRARVDEAAFVLGCLQHLGKPPALGDVRDDGEAAVGTREPADAAHSGRAPMLKRGDLLRARLQARFEGRVGGQLRPQPENLQVPAGAIGNHDAVPEAVEEAGVGDGCAGHGSAPFRCTGTRRDNKTGGKPARMEPADVGRQPICHQRLS